MSKNFRLESKTDFYHVMVRGVNRQKIFHDDQDRRRFLYLLKINTMLQPAEVHAFCLMENHVHILIKARKDNLSNYMQATLSSYVRYYNKKTERTGHLFDNRFKSEPVNDEIYYLTVLRYILQNPEKAMLCHTIDYKWSSVNAYRKKTFVTTDFALSLFSSYDSLLKFITSRNTDECMDVPLTSEEKALKSNIIFNYIVGKYKAESVKNMPKYRRNYLIHELKRNGISIRRIQNLTGVSKSVIQRI